MRFSRHALDKLHIYKVSEEEVLRLLPKPVYRCLDKFKGSEILVIELDKSLYSIVVKDGLIITVYRTDLRKLYSRVRSGRWNCR